MAESSVEEVAAVASALAFRFFAVFDSTGLEPLVGVVLAICGRCKELGGSGRCVEDRILSEDFGVRSKSNIFM